MRSCWHRQPEERLSFIELEQRIFALMENERQCAMTPLQPPPVIRNSQESLNAQVLNDIYVPGGGAEGISMVEF